MDGDISDPDLDSSHNLSYNQGSDYSDLDNSGKQFESDGDSLDLSNQSYYQENDVSMLHSGNDNLEDGDLPNPLDQLISNATEGEWTSLTYTADEPEGEELLLPKPPSPLEQLSKENRLKKEGKSKKEIEEEEREKMQVLVSNFTEDQLDRYEMFRRSAFPKASIKRIMQTITGCSVSQNVVIAMAGITKVFVAEIVEEALDVMESYGESGPLQPKHLRESVRRLRLRPEQHIPTMQQKRNLFMH